MQNNSKSSTNIIGIIIAFVLGFGTLYGLMHLFPNTFVKTITKLEKDVTVNENGIADAVEKVYDSVVVVFNYKNSQAIASGTGFVYDVEGSKAYILTNYHVIENGTDFYVKFTNDKQEKVELIGGDKYSDIAVLSISKDKIISTSEIGSTDKTRVGDTVFAVGAPLNDAYSWSVTRGILSGKDRMVEVALNNSYKSDYVMKVLQTDTAINSGNSGGPLSNSNGEVIGITSMKLATTGVEGMGFAIPIETALHYASLIRSGNEIVRPYIGVGLNNVSDVMYYDRQYNSYIQELGINSGVIVSQVENDGIAYKSGLKTGDIIVDFDGEAVKSTAYFKYMLYSHELGDTIKLNVIRDKKNINIEMVLK